MTEVSKILFQRDNKSVASGVEGENLANKLDGIN